LSRGVVPSCLGAYTAVLWPALLRPFSDWSVLELTWIP